MYCSPGYSISSIRLMSLFLTTKQKEFRTQINYRYGLIPTFLSTTDRIYDIGPIKL